MADNGQRGATLVRMFEASVMGDSSVVGEIFTDDVHGRGPALSVSSAAELAVEIEDRESAFSDVEVDASPLDVGGDRAAMEWVLTATHSGTLEVAGDLIEATGARITLHGVTVAEFEGDRIRSFRQYWDEVELFRQLAVDPPASRSKEEEH